MSSKKKKPAVLLIEGCNLSETIILALENLETNNQKLKEAITANNSQLDKIRKMLGNI